MIEDLYGVPNLLSKDQIKHLKKWIAVTVTFALLDMVSPPCSPVALLSLSCRSSRCPRFSRIHLPGLPGLPRVCAPCLPCFRVMSGFHPKL